MSHGKKKWITDYRGRLKRSRNRTKFDRVSGAIHGKPESRRLYYRWSREKPKCPQCRYVWKQFDHDVESWLAMREAVYAEFHQKYGDRSWVRLADGKTLYLFDYFRQHPKYFPLWSYDSYTFLCFKCEQREKAVDDHWTGHPHGTKRAQNWFNKNQRRKYRAKVKNLMRQERYDDITPYTHDWF